MNKNLLEWTVFGVSLALIAACVIVLGYEQATRTSQPPSIEARVGEVIERGDGFAVELIVRNTGDRTAQAVQLEVTVRGTSERAETTLQYVPYRSQRRAWVIFADDPRRSTIIVRVLGFEEP